MPRPSLRRARRRLRRIVLLPIAIALLVPAFDVTSAGADPIDDQRQRVEALTDELERLEESAARYGEQHSVAVREQRELAEEIEEAEGRIGEKEKLVGDLRNDLGEVAVDAYINAGGGNLGPLFESADEFSANRQREQYSKVALSVGSGTTDDLDEAVADLEAERDDLEAKRAEAEELAEQAASAREQAEASKQDYQSERAAAEQELGRLIQEEEERRAREAYEAMLAEQARQQEELERQQAAEAEAARQAQEAAAAEAAAAAAAEAAEAEVEAAAEQTATPPPAPAPAPAPDTGDDGGDGTSSEPQTFSPPPPPTPPPPVVEGPSSMAQVAINAALSEVGTPWVFAMAQPGVGFDCSGLTSWAWAQAGVSMPHQSAQQYAVLPHVPVSSAQPGDLLFYYSPISHVGIYLGNGQLVHSPNSTTTVKVAAVSWENVVGAARPG